MAKELTLNLETIDGNLAEYYKLKNVSYDSLLASWCEDNGIDDEEALQEEFDADPNDSTMADPEEGFADGEFPFPSQHEETAVTIMKILQICRQEAPNFAIFADDRPRCMLH